MELLSPGIGLFLWLMVVFCMVPLLIVALVHLMRRRLPASEKALWVLLIVVMPFIGIVVYFLAYYTTNKSQRQ